MLKIIFLKTICIKRLSIILGLLTIFLTAPVFDEIKAQNKDETTISIWPARYTPSRVLATAGYGAKAAVKGIDPIIEAYQKLHPNVKIKVIGQAINKDIRRWMNTSLAGGTAPDIMWYLGDWAVEDYKKSWLVPINKYLEKPNPYITSGQPGSKRWRDLFLPGIDFWRAPNNDLYLVLADQIQVCIYYNKEIFKKVGLDGPPKTWEEMMLAADKIQKSGSFGFAATGNNLHQLTWVSGWLTNFYHHSEIRRYDKNGDGILNKIEMATAVKNKSYTFTGQRNRQRLEQLKRYASYWQPGALGAGFADAMSLFVKGRAGMFVSYSPHLPTLMNDEKRKFDIGIFYLPVVDSATSKLISDNVPPTNKSMGYGSFQYSITNTAVERGTVDVSIDFLMFATQPKQINQMILEGGIALPGIYGAPHNPKLESFKESVSYAPAPYQEDDSMFDSVFSEKFLAITSPYLVGKQNLDETVRRLDAEALKAAKRILE